MAASIRSDSLGQEGLHAAPYPPQSIPLSSKEFSTVWSFAAQARRGYYIGSHAGGLYLFEPGTNAVSLILNLKQSICWIQEDRAMGTSGSVRLGGSSSAIIPSAVATAAEHSTDPGGPVELERKARQLVSRGQIEGHLVRHKFRSPEIRPHDGQLCSLHHRTWADGRRRAGDRGGQPNGTYWVSTTNGISEVLP